MRYSRNRSDLPKAFSAKVAARIQAERHRGGISQVWCRQHCPGVACVAAAEGHTHAQQQPAEGLLLAIRACPGSARAVTTPSAVLG